MLSWPLLNYITNRLVVLMLIDELADLIISASIKTHDSESRGQEEAGCMRDEQVSYLHVAPL